MWLSASAFFHRYYRVYSPVSFGQRWSKAPDFIRHYLPVLAKVPNKYIFEPWKMPAAVAREAGVALGGNYPHRIVDHDSARRENIERMKAVYAVAHEAGGREEGKAAPAGANGRANTGGKRRLPSCGRGGAKSYKMSK
jgi:cryptochrome